MLTFALYDGTGALDAHRAIDEITRRLPTPQQKRNMAGVRHDFALVMGRPAEALRAARQLADSAADSLAVTNMRILLLRDAMFGDGDTTGLGETLRALTAADERPLAADSATRSLQRAVARALELWRVARGDTTHTRRSLERLRLIARTDSSARTTEGQVEVALIEALHARQAHAPHAAAALERLDSLLRSLDYQNVHIGRTAVANLVAAQLFEQRGDVKRALAAARRRTMALNQAEPYLATQLREEARLAALAGETDEAIRAYEHYLALRVSPEPALRQQVEEARRERDRLVKGKG
jgi:hypothetical protein